MLMLVVIPKDMVDLSGPEWRMTEKKKEKQMKHQILIILYFNFNKPYQTYDKYIELQLTEYVIIERLTLLNFIILNNDITQK